MTRWNELLPDITDLSVWRANVAILAGAGLSVDPPCCAPTGLSLVSELIKKLSADSHHLGHLKALAFPKEFSTVGTQSTLRFEHIMQALHDSGSDVGFKFLTDILSSREPNENHSVLRALIESGAVVLTTNFDTCVERACENESIQRLVIPDQLAAPAPTSPLKGLIKLHGTLYDNASFQPSIRTLVSTIARLRSPFLGDHWLGLALKECLASRPLVIAGYSGMDDFDVVPLLLATTSEQPIVWIEHSDHSLQVRTWRDIDVRLQLTNGRSTWKSELLLHAMGRTGVRRRSQIFHVLGPTRVILQALNGHKTESPSRPTDRRSLTAIANRHFNFDARTRKMATGLLYLSSGESDEAWRIFRNLRAELETGNDVRKTHVFRNLSESLIRDRRESEALEAARAALELSTDNASKASTDPSDQIAIIFDLAKSKLMLSRAEAAAGSDTEYALDILESAFSDLVMVQELADRNTRQEAYLPVDWNHVYTGLLFNRLQLRRNRLTLQDYVSEANEVIAVCMKTGERERELQARCSVIIEHLRRRAGNSEVLRSELSYLNGEAEREHFVHVVDINRNWLRLE